MTETFVPFYDHAATYRSLRLEIDAAIRSVLEAGCYADGDQVAGFEKEFAAYCGTKHAVTAGSCRDAMYKALLALEVGKGHEVITVSNTCVGGTVAISQVGARIVWADISDRTWNMDPTELERLVTRRTRAVVVPHMYGHPADMDEILEISAQHGLAVVEDAAIAVGATYKGRRVGALGDVACFSHVASKILAGCGDGGTATTNRDDLAKRIRDLSIYSRSELRSVGKDGTSVHSGFLYEREGLHGRIGELNAAVLRVKLRHLEGWMVRRRQIAGAYSECLRALDIEPPAKSDEVGHAYRNYTICVEDRDEVRTRLRAQGVETNVQYSPALHTQPVYRKASGTAVSLPVTEKVVGSIVNLPIYPELSDAQVESVCAALVNCVRSTRSHKACSR